MDWSCSLFTVFLICTIYFGNCIDIKPATILRANSTRPNHPSEKRLTLNTGNATSSNNRKKTLIDITGSEFPETNYQQQEFFFDTTHDFGEFDNEEILRQSEVKLDDDYDSSVPGNGRSDLLSSKQDSSFNALTQESFDNDDLEAINLANEQAMEKYGTEQDDTYKYDDDANSFYPTTPG